MRVVLDTNVLISGLLGSKGAPGRILDAWRAGQFDLVVSDALVDEFKRVCSYPKLVPYLTSADVGTLINRLRAAECWVADLPRVKLSADANDDFLLAMAQASGADYLVTGDHAGLLVIGNIGRTKIMTAASFVSLVE